MATAFIKRANSFSVKKFIFIDNKIVKFYIFTNDKSNRNLTYYRVTIRPPFPMEAFGCSAPESRCLPRSGTMATTMEPVASLTPERVC